MILPNTPLGIQIAGAIVLFLFLLFHLFHKRFCFYHFKKKDFKVVNNGQRFCSHCLAETYNPKTWCQCGWKGRLLDCKEYEAEGDIVYHYDCPVCETEIPQI